MENSQYKRQNNNTFASEAQYSDTTVRSLSTMAMRIRKAVAEGYKTGANSDYNIQQANSQNSSRPFQRVPLPASMSTPPSLSFGVSTSSSLSDWETSSRLDNAPIQTISSGTSFQTSKRKFDDGDDEDGEDGHTYGGGYTGASEFYQPPQMFNPEKFQNINQRQTQVSGADYESKYGSLKFDEEF